MLGEILVTRSYDFAKPNELRDFLRRVLGDGLVVVEGDEHKFQRKHIMPVFSFRHIKNLYPMMWEKAVELTKAIEAEIHENPDPAFRDEKHTTGVVEINHWANKVTMDIIGIAGLGREFNMLKNGDDELIENYEEILEPTVERGIYFALCLIFPAKLVESLPWKLNERLRITTENINRICLDLVREKKLALEKGEEHVNILSTLVKSNNFSEKELVDQMLTFLAAGFALSHFFSWSVANATSRHETTSSAFTWTAYFLAKYPEFQSKVRVEVRKAIPQNPWDNASALEELSDTLEGLPYLNAVCSETQRLFPTVPITLRTAVRDTQLGNIPVPKGTQILMSPMAVNRSYELWGENADEFTPERWIDEKNGELRPNNTGGANSNYSYLTFLHGPRSCIGQGFAKAELRVLVAAFVGAFEMSLADPNEEVELGGTVTLKPVNGMKLRLKAVRSW